MKVDWDSWLTVQEWLSSVVIAIVMAVVAAPEVVVMVLLSYCRRSMALRGAMSVRSVVGAGKGVSVAGKHGAAAMMDVRGSQQEGDEISGGRITRQRAVKRAFMSSLPDWLPDVNKVHTPSVFNK